MQYASGVARIFVQVDNGEDGRLAQLDFKPKGAEGHQIPDDIPASVDRVTINTRNGAFECNLLSIGPLVRSKIKAHHNREVEKDYNDLVFVCCHQDYAPLVRQAAVSYEETWKEFLLEKVMENNPESESQVRWALDLEAEGEAS